MELNNQVSSSMDYSRNQLFHMSYQVDLLFSALSAAQAEFPAIKKTDQAHRHKYANINSVLEAVRSVLQKHGLSIQQHPSTDNLGNAILTSILSHSSGQYSLSSIRIIHDPQDIQSLGSGITYTRRYALVSILGLEQEDDDGNYQKDKAIQKKEEVMMITTDQINKLVDKIKKSADPEETINIVQKSTNLLVKDFGKMTQKQFEWIMKKIS